MRSTATLQQVEQVTGTVDGADPEQVTGREAGLLLGGQSLIVAWSSIRS